MRSRSHESGEEILDRAFDELEEQTPDQVTKAIRWIRSPQSRWMRLPLGILCIIASFFWFLPVIGVEFFPIGLLLIAQDVPFLRRPVGRFVLWLEDRWITLKRWYRRKRRVRNA